MYDRILLTGATGFLGRHTLPVLEDRYGKDKVVGVSSKDYNLMDPIEHKKMYEDIKPDVVVHYAAYSGGIGANKKYPADFYYINTILTTYGFQFASEYNVKKFIYPMGGCSYPADAKSPIDESQMWKGFPQSESAGYSSAKKMGILAGWAYRKQMGLKASVIIPGNMYGEYDNFDKEASHVVPAMIRRYYEATLENRSFVEMWGTGLPERDFVYAGDVAKLIPYFIEEYDSDEVINISSGTRTPIKILAETIKEITGYKGEIRWDTSKPDGQMIKIFDIKKLNSLGLECNTKLKDGIEQTFKWLQANYADETDGIRI